MRQNFLQRKKLLQKSKTKSKITNVKTPYKDDKGRAINLNPETNRYFVKRRRKDGSIYTQTILDPSTNFKKTLKKSKSKSKSTPQTKSKSTPQTKSKSKSKSTLKQNLNQKSKLTLKV